MSTRPRHWLRLDSSVFWVLVGTIALIVLSFWSLDLQLGPHGQVLWGVVIAQP
jgi:hypothetical protein